MWNPTKKEIVISRNVVFDETILKAEDEDDLNITFPSPIYSISPSPSSISKSPIFEKDTINHFNPSTSQNPIPT